MKKVLYVSLSLVFSFYSCVSRNPAGILPYAFYNNQMWILLGQEAQWIRNYFWSDFGGSADPSDTSITYTAAREATEETRYVYGNGNYKQSINYLLPRLSQKYATKVDSYTMFFAQVDYKDSNLFRNGPTVPHYDKVDYAWIPIRELSTILQEAQRIHGATDAPNNVYIPKKYASPKNTTQEFRMYNRMAGALLSSTGQEILTNILQQEAQRQQKPAAGILPYIFYNNQMWILLGQGIRQYFWGDFGGSADSSDTSTKYTAARKATEGTRYVYGDGDYDYIKSINYFLSRLSNKYATTVDSYTMFFAQVNYKDINLFRNGPEVLNSKADYALVPARELFDIVQNAQKTFGPQAEKNIRIPQRYASPTNRTGEFRLYQSMARRLLSSNGQKILKEILQQEAQRQHPSTVTLNTALSRLSIELVSLQFMLSP